MHNTKKSLMLQLACVLSKNNLVQKTSKSDDQQCLALFLYLFHERTQVLVPFQHYHVTQRLVLHNSVGNKTKSIRPRLRPRPKLQDQDQDRGRSCHKTAVSDPKTALGTNQTPNMHNLSSLLANLRVERCRSTDDFMHNKPLLCHFQNNLCRPVNTGNENKRVTAMRTE